MGASLLVNEIFLSLQGESTRAGLPSVFIRLTGCNLRCVYCDTTYAYDEGRRMELRAIIERVDSYECRMVEITGGEPMEQTGTAELAKLLLERGYAVMIETNGSVNLASLPEKVIKIVDMKCPDSGAGDSFLPKNMERITPDDEFKFVVSSKSDFEWAVKEMENHNLLSICTVNVSPAYGKVKPEELADWILESGKNLRLNLPLHKILWGNKRAR